jgi:hypothetical protein
MEEKAKEMFYPLREVDLTVEDKLDILQALRSETSLDKPKRRRNAGYLPGVAAAIAAVAVVAGGVSFEMHQHQPITLPRGQSSQHNVTTGSNQTETPVTPTPSGTVSGNSNRITTKTYANLAQANAVVANLEQSFGQVYPSGPLVDLGTGIQAAFNGGAGQYKYQWHEGNWTLDMLGFGNSSTGTQVAKNVVAYLHTNMLPPPNNKGVIIMTSSATGATWTTQVAWQEGAAVSQIQQSGDPVTVLQKVVNSYRDAGTSASATGFHQTFQHSGGASSVFLTPTTGFQVKNLGGGASNFVYQFSKTTDGGKSWINTSTGRFSDVYGVSFINQQTGYLLNNSPAYSVTPDLYVTHDGGVTWNEQKLPIPSAYSNYYRSSDFPIFFSAKVGFIPVYGISSTNQSSTTQFLYMLVTTDGGTSWTPVTGTQAKGLSWTLSGQKLTVTDSTQTITVNGLFGMWSVSP